LTSCDVEPGTGAEAFSISSAQVDVKIYLRHKSLCEFLLQPGPFQIRKTRGHSLAAGWNLRTLHKYAIGSWLNQQPNMASPNVKNDKSAKTKSAVVYIILDTLYHLVRSGSVSTR